MNCLICHRRAVGKVTFYRVEGGHVCQDHKNWKPRILKIGKKQKKLIKKEAHKHD
jgi:hypothetical protein